MERSREQNCSASPANWCEVEPVRMRQDVLVCGRGYDQMSRCPYVPPRFSCWDKGAFMLYCDALLVADLFDLLK